MPGGRRFLLRMPGCQCLPRPPPTISSAAACSRRCSGCPAVGQPAQHFVGFKDGKHGTEIFGPHPELPRTDRRVVRGYAGEITGRSEDAGHGEDHAGVRVLEARSTRRTASPRPRRSIHEARQKDPNAYRVPRERAEPLGLRKAAGRHHEGRRGDLSTEHRGVSAIRQRARQSRRRLSGGRAERPGACGGEEMPRDAGDRPEHRGIQEGHPRQSAEEKIAKLQ